jgi:hypothetical protein
MLLQPSALLPRLVSLTRSLLRRPAFRTVVAVALSVIHVSMSILLYPPFLLMIVAFFAAFFFEKM